MDGRPLGAAEIHVAPGGHDDSDGSPTHPLHTLHRAQALARSLAPAPRRGGVAIVLADGVHHLPQPLVLTGRDSGSPGAPVTYRAGPGARPAVSGGVVVGSFHDEGDGTWSAPVGALDTRQLYLDGRRLSRTTRPPPPGMVRTDTGYSLGSDELAGGRNPTDIELVFNVNWTQMRGGVAAVDGTEVTMDQPWFSNARWHPMAMVDLPDRIENVFELLATQPGTWYLDRTAQRVHVHPPPGIDLADAEVVAPAITTLVDVRGTNEEPVHDVSFEGLTFAHTTWPMCFGGQRGLAALQANLALTGSLRAWSPETGPHWQGSMMPAAVQATYARRVRIEGCRFSHLGAAGLGLGRGSKDSEIAGNRFDDISGTAIAIGNGDDHHAEDEASVRGIRVANNVLRQVAVEYQGGVGIWAGYVADTVIEHNDLRDLPYTAISVGWGWGQHDPTIMANNHIVANRIERPMQVLLDGGGIYVLSAQPGMRIARNVVTDQPTIMGALYLDDGCRYVTVEDNVVLDSYPRGEVMIRVRDEVVPRGGEWGSFRFKGRDHVICGNWWDHETQDCWGLFEGGTVGTNHQIASVGEVPTALLAEAGVEPTYHHLLED